jgi:tetratricopeptide (TPR) repeat protein
MTVALTELDVAWALLGQQRFADAARQAQSVLARFPDNVSALACHAMANWKSGGDAELSLAQMRRAVALAPDVASVRHNLATLLASRGDMTEAAEQFRQALRIKPDDTLAFYGLTQNSKFRARDALVEAMVALHGAPGLDRQRREFLTYGLAKVFSDLGEAGPAMSYAIEANELGQRPFDYAGEGRALDELQELARLDAFRRAPGSGNASTAPLFIVGMNRSGTTLVESILSRHPEVLAQGEASHILDTEAVAAQRRGPAGHDIGRHQLALELGRDWLAARAGAILQSAARGASAPFKVLTDKLPENAVRLGLVARLFPRARVIHVRRHPLDAGVSNFFQRFSAGQGFSTRLDWIGARTRQIADSMEIWKTALDLPILDVSYERLVADPETEARRLVAFAGLDWDPACLEPERTQRSVLTASQWQVRQPIYRGSVDRWRRYEPWLGPMIEAMGGFAWIDREVAASSGEGR